MARPSIQVTELKVYGAPGPILAPVVVKPSLLQFWTSAGSALLGLITGLAVSLLSRGAEAVGRIFEGS